MSFDKQRWDGLLRKLGGMMMFAEADGGHHLRRRSDCCGSYHGSVSLHRRRSSSLELQFPVIHEPLKDASSSLDVSSSSSGSRRSIQFDSVVSVVRIPSHTTYSSRDKKHLWATNYETRENAKRNRREFAAEHYDWKQCVEEDDMYFDSCSSEYIHPVHLNRYMMDE